MTLSWCSFGVGRLGPGTDTAYRHSRVRSNTSPVGDGFDPSLHRVVVGGVWIRQHNQRDARHADIIVD